MRTFSFPARRRMAVLLWMAFVFAASVVNAHAQTTGSLTTIRALNGPNGENPTQALTLGADGNFYGVTTYGGASNNGAIFRVTPAGTVTVLHSFSGATDGYYPQCKLLLASDGNFYGTAQTGGPLVQTSSGVNYGNGTVFRLTPAGVFTVVYTFSNDGLRGRVPAAGLIQGSDGALYGTTQYGDATSSTGGDGTIFRLTPSGAFTLLHTFNFHQTGVGGYAPNTPLVQGSDGYFYGVTQVGGDSGVGVVYRVSAGGTFTNLHSFNGRDGSTPVGPLVEGDGGVLYGITAGGANGSGTFFKVVGSTGALTTPHAFTGYGESSNPQSGLVKAADGTFYLTTASGGNGYGNILQLTSAGVVNNVYKFKSNADGTNPYGALAQAADGSFYGTTRNGGVSGYGTIFQLVVSPHPPFFAGEADLDNGVEYLAFPNGNFFGYFSYLADPHYIYHQDMGYEYVFDADDGQGGVYLYDFKSSDFFYTSPTFGFPYLYDFNLGAVLYYYPDPNNAGRYNTNGARYFFNYKTGKIISK